MCIFIICNFLVLPATLASVVSTTIRSNMTESVQSSPIYYRTTAGRLKKSSDRTQAPKSPQLPSHPEQPQQQPKQPSSVHILAQQPITVTKNRNLFPSDSQQQFRRDSNYNNFPVLRTVQKNVLNNQFQSFFSNQLKMFSKFKFKGFALSFIKSATELKSLGFGVKIPVTPNFPIYDSFIYLPRIVSMISLNYPYCWKLSFTINVPIQVYTMLMVLLIDYATHLYESFMSVRFIRRFIGDSLDDKDSMDDEDDEEANELMNTFSDREVSPSQRKKSAATQKAPKLKMPVLKTSESVKRVGVGITYKWTNWGAKGNGWTMGPAFNYVSSLIITNKLLPMMILVSVVFFSITETMVLLLYWMYEIYYFLVENFLLGMNGLVYWFQSNMGTLVNTPTTSGEGKGESSQKIYYDSPNPTPYYKEQQPASHLAKKSTTSPSTSSSSFFVTSNNDISTYSESDQDRIEDVLAHQSSSPMPATPVPGDVLSSVSSSTSSSQSTGKVKSFMASVRSQYQNYAQSKLSTQRPLGMMPTSTNNSSTSHTLFQINWKKIEKWILTKSPVFGYSMSTVLLPFPSKGLKLATNLNFDVQGFHPVEYLNKLMARAEVDNSLGKTSFMLGATVPPSPAPPSSSSSVHTSTTAPR